MLHHVYTDVSGATKYYRSHYNQWCCLHWMLRGSTRQIPDRKLLPRSIYDILTQKNYFQWSLYGIQCRQTLAVAAWRVRCRHSVTHLKKRTKATSAFDRSPSAPWVLSFGKLVRYLHGSYFFSCRFADVFHLVFFPAISIFLSVARLGCSLNALSSISWIDTPLTADWLQVCFGTLPWLSFIKHFWKFTYPTFNSSQLFRSWMN